MSPEAPGTIFRYGIAAIGTACALIVAIEAWRAHRRETRVDRYRRADGQ